MSSQPNKGKGVWEEANDGEDEKLGVWEEAVRRVREQDAGSVRGKGVRRKKRSGRKRSVGDLSIMNG
jgi:hypothetical protein